MEDKNPLEDLRTEILKNQSDGYVDDFIRTGIADNILMICDALDGFYGINRSQKTSGNEVLDALNLYHKPSYSYYSRKALDMPFSSRTYFSSVNNLIKVTKIQLLDIKQKTSKDNPFYLNLSSLIAAIAVRDVVSIVNNYQKPKAYTNSYYSQVFGIDFNYCNLINDALKVMSSLRDFDMTQECENNYEENRKSLVTISQAINEAVSQNDKSSSPQTESGGCMVFVIVLFASIISIGYLL